MNSVNVLVSALDDVIFDLQTTAPPGFRGIAQRTMATQLSLQKQSILAIQDFGLSDNELAAIVTEEAKMQFIEHLVDSKLKCNDCF